jgi:hypothetical protein
MPAATANLDLGEDMERLSQGQIIAAVAAVVLLVAEFLPWLGASGSATVTGPSGSISVGGSQNFNLWDGSTLDIYALIVAVVALTPAVLAFSGSAEEFSFMSAATFLLGVVGVILVIAFLTVDFPDGASRKIGAWIGLVAMIAIAYGGFRAMQEEVAAEI